MGKTKRSKGGTPPDVVGIKPAFRNPFISPEGIKPSTIAKPQAPKEHDAMLSPSTPAIGSPTNGSPEDKARPSKPSTHDDTKTPPPTTLIESVESSPVYDTDSPGSDIKSPVQKAMDRSAVRSNPMFIGESTDNESMDADESLPMELSPEPPTPLTRMEDTSMDTATGGGSLKRCFLCDAPCLANEAPRQKDEAGRYSHVACVGLMRKAKLSVDTKNQSEDDTWRELADALTSVDGFTRAVDAGRSFIGTPGSSPSSKADASKMENDVGTPVVSSVGFFDSVGPAPRPMHRGTSTRPGAYRRLLAPDAKGEPQAMPSPGVAMRSAGPTGYSLPGTPRSSSNENENANAPDPLADSEAAFADAFKAARTSAGQVAALAAVARATFRLTDVHERLRGVYACCKGENPLDSGELFVFDKHVCFRRTKTSLFDPRACAAPTKFAVPASAIVDARANPAVYPFGAILLAVDGAADPWLFSFFTERVACLECVNGMLDDAVDPVRRSAMRAKHAEERERRARELETSHAIDLDEDAFADEGEDKENVSCVNAKAAKAPTAAEIIHESRLKAASIVRLKAVKTASPVPPVDVYVSETDEDTTDEAPSPTRSVLDLNESKDPRDKWHHTRDTFGYQLKRVVYSVVGVSVLVFGGVGECVNKAREAHARAKRRDERFPRQWRRKSGTKGKGKAGMKAPARSGGLKPKRGWDPIRA